MWPGQENTATSPSAFEVELVACNHGLRTEGNLGSGTMVALPRKGDESLSLPGEPSGGLAHSDRYSSNPTVHKSASSVCRVAARTQRLKGVQLEDCNTEVMAADIFTKHFIDPEK